MRALRNLVRRIAEAPPHPHRPPGNHLHPLDSTGSLSPPGAGAPPAVATSAWPNASSYSPVPNTLRPEPQTPNCKF